MDLIGIVAIVLGSSVTSAIVTLMVDAKRRQRSEHHHNSYLALRIAFVLENYAIRCADMMSEHQFAEDSDGQGREFMTNIPDLESPPDGEYRSFDQSILSEVLDFPQRIAMAKAEARSAFEVVGGEEATENTYKSVVDLAAHALSVGAKIRTRYACPERKLEYGGFNVRGYVMEAARKLSKK